MHPIWDEGGIGHKCLRVTVGGMLNGECSCCTELNETFELGIWAAGVTHISDFNDVCDGQFMLTSIYSGSYYQPSSSCACITGFGQTYARSHEKCEGRYFFVRLEAVVSGASCNYGFGWLAAGVDDIAVQVAITQLSAGEVVRLPIIAGQTCENCDTSAAYADVSLVDCAGINPPTFQEEQCEQIFLECVNYGDLGSLTLSEFEDCTIADFGGRIRHEQPSNLNGVYEVESVELPLPWPCDGTTLPNGGLVYYTPLGTMGEFLDPGILTLDIEDETPVTIGDDTVFSHDEQYVYGLVASASCGDVEPETGHGHVTLNLTLVEFYKQQFSVYRFADGTFHSVLGGAIIFCDVYAYPQNTFVERARVSDCIAGFGSGLVSSRFPYGLCDSTETGEFLATLGVTSTP